MLDTKLKTKLRNMYPTPHCPVCDGVCYESDSDKLEYIRTKRGTVIFVHTECVKKWGDK